MKIFNASGHTVGCLNRRIRHNNSYAMPAICGEIYGTGYMWDICQVALGMTEPFWPGSRKLMAYLSPSDQSIIETRDEQSQPHFCFIGSSQWVVSFYL